MLAERLVTRNLMKCESCKHLTGKCMWCEDGFVRAYPDDHMDKVCAICCFTLVGNQQHFSCALNVIIYFRAGAHLSPHSKRRRSRAPGVCRKQITHCIASMLWGTSQHVSCVFEIISGKYWLVSFDHCRSRNDYTCNSCGHLTVNCVGCADAMAK